MNTLTTYLIISALLFSLGLLGILQRRNLIGMLISVELMLNAANINFMAFNRFLSPEPVTGQIIALFVMGLAAAEAALALNKLNGARDGVTFNVGAIDGGGAVYVVPERAVLRFNIRVPDAEAAVWAESEVRRVARDAGARDGIEAHLHGGFTRPPKPLAGPQRTMVSWTHQAGAALGLDLLVQVHGVLLQASDVGVAVERVHATRRVPRAAGSELLALEQHHVGPAGLGEVVEHAGADDAATDHDDLCG